MQRARGHFLAGAGFAGDQNRGTAGRDQLDDFDHLRIGALEPTSILRELRRWWRLLRAFALDAVMRMATESSSQSSSGLHQVRTRTETRPALCQLGALLTTPRGS